MSWIEDPGVEMFQGLNLTSLDIDEAYVRFNNNGTSSAWFYSLSDDCYNCPYTRVSVIEPPNQVIVVDTTHSQYWRVTSKNIGVNLPQDDKSNVICDIAPDIGEFGVYSVNVKGDSCDFNVEKEPVNIYLPLLILFFIILGMVLVWKLIPIIIRRFFLKKKVEDLKKEPVRKRVKSLDTFRGLSIVLMIFVNSGAGRYWWLEHATWNGLTVGDLVFPWFLWIMGVCIPMSVRSIVVKDLSKVEALLNIFRRSCILFLLGIALGSIFGPLLDNMRIFGVLQRFGVSYWIVASIMVILGKKRDTPDGKWMKMFWDITEIGLQWIIMLILILVHVIVIFYAPMPDCPTGYLGAGGKQDNWANPWCIGGITMYIDVSVLGSSHLYQNPTAKHVYESGAFDPEGIFGCLLSIVHVFLGVQAGNTLQHHKKWKPLIIRWLIWAAVLGLIGGILCNFSKHDGVIPVNKNLWSLSFMLITCSFAFIVLSIFYMLIDVWELWNGSPFLQPGMNSITMYVGHSICYAMFPFHWNIPNMRTHFVFLMENAWATFLWVLLSCEMARNNFYLSI